MLTEYIHGNFIVDGEKRIDDGVMTVRDDRITGVDHVCDVSADQVIDLQGKTVTPGFIDLHIHGALGKDFIQGKEAAETVSMDLPRDGTTAFLSSLTVLSQEEQCKTLRSLAQADCRGARYLGVHLEGPYLSVQYKALMDERYLRDPSLAELAQDIASNSRIRSMTVAPERKGMDSFIPELRKHGIVPCIGHTAASCKQAEDAISWGALSFTHLYNACTQMEHRDTGVVTAAFLHPEVKKELIMDGFHVQDDVLRMTLKYLSPKQIIMITDAMLGKDCPDGDYIFSGLKCHKEGKHVRVIETGRIAGSAIGMNDAARHISELCHLTPNDIVQMGCVNPAELLGEKDIGSLTAGKKADFVIWNENWNIDHTYIDGKLFL